MITTTISSSIRVNPRLLCRFIVGPLRGFVEWSWVPERGKRGPEASPDHASLTSESLPEPRGGLPLGRAGDLTRRAGRRGTNGRGRRGAVEDHAALSRAERAVRGAGRPARSRRSNADGHTLGRNEGQRGGAVGVGVEVGVVDLLLAREVLEVRLHRGEVRLLTGRGELRDGDGRQDPDDHDHDEELDQGEALFVTHTSTTSFLGCEGPS